jgi:ABC-2 type transport system ATP-binding protein
MNAIEWRAASKHYGRRRALDAFDLAIPVGTCWGLLGPNGAGKTTALQLLLGLMQPTSGEALLFGQRYQELKDPARRVGAVLESNDFHPGRSGRDHLLGIALAARIDDGRVDEVLELVGLLPAARRRVQTYSFGMRQRLGLAGALLGDPELLILDEPTNGLDPAGAYWLRGLLRHFAEHGRTVLVSSHALAEIAQTVDQVVIIDRGRLVTTMCLDQLTDQRRTLEDLYLELTAKDASS